MQNVMKLFSSLNDDLSLWYFGVKQRQIVPLLITKAFSWHLSYHGGKHYSDWGWHKKCGGFYLIDHEDYIISSFRLCQRRARIRSRAFGQNTLRGLRSVNTLWFQKSCYFTHPHRGFVQSFGYLIDFRVLWYGRDLGWLCIFQNMLALRVFEVCQDVCAKTIMSLFEQLNLYSSTQPIRKLHGQFHAAVVINRKWIKRPTAWACLTSVSNVSFEIGGRQKLNALQCLPLSISKTCYIGNTIHDLCCKQTKFLKLSNS